MREEGEEEVMIWYEKTAQTMDTWGSAVIMWIGFKGSGKIFMFC